MADEKESTGALSIPEAGRDGEPPVTKSPTVETPALELKPSTAEISFEIEPPPPAVDDKPVVHVDLKMISYPYSLQLGAFREIKEADKLIFTCKEKGMSAYRSEVELADGVWYRVFVGYFEDRKSAENFKEEHGLHGAGVKHTKYANLIDTYSSFRELEDKILSLRNLGHSPYVIKDPDDSFRLLVGSFLSKEGAEKQYDDLMADGIMSQIIER